MWEMWEETDVGGVHALLLPPTPVFRIALNQFSSLPSSFREFFFLVSFGFPQLLDGSRLWE